MERPNRVANRLANYDYSQEGAYFVTICTRERKRVLSQISVGTGVLDCPQIRLLRHGEIAEKYLRQMNEFYGYLSVDKYAIMPDHIHILITVRKGQSRTPVPTHSGRIDNRNSTISKFVSTFKRFCNKEYGEDIWQGRYYDHVIRNQQDYNEIWEYIENNPKKWKMRRIDGFC